MSFFKQLISLVLVIQLILPQNVGAQSPENPNSSEASSDAQLASQIAAKGLQSPEDRQKFIKLESMADSLESSEEVPSEISATPIDIFQLSDQRVEILEKGVVVKTYSLNEVRAKYEDIAISELRSIYNSERRELIIEGVVGAKSDGQGGVVKARHIIPNMDILSMKQSNEFLVFINSQGHVGAIDMGFVSKQIFKNPIFVVRDVWKPKNQVQLTDVQIKFMTPGTDPLTREAYTGYIYTVDEHGEPRWFNGDVRITTANSGSEEVFALLPRSHFYLRTELAAAMILSKIALLDPNAKAIEHLKNVLSKAEKLQVAVEEIPGGYDQNLKNFIGNIEPDQILALNQSQNAMSEYSKRRFGDQTLTEAMERFQQIKKAKESLKNPFAEIDEMEKNWYKYIQSQKVESPFRRTFSDVLSDTILKYSNKGSILAGIGVLSALYVGFPFAYENFDWSSVRLLNWFYLNGLPEVLNQPYTVLPRDMDGVTLMEVVNYRFYNLANIVALIMLWPAAHVAAYGYKKVLGAVHSMVKNSNTHFASFIREMQSNWGKLSNWQVVTSFGMRVYSKFIYPMVRLGLEKALRQKSFFMATENRLNPFQRISKKSELGKTMGLDRSIYLGLNNPLSSAQKSKQTTELQEKAQTLLKVQNMKRSQMAFTLATLTVSEIYGIDPATLMNLSSGDLKIEDLSTIFNNQRRKSEWYLSAQKIYDWISKDQIEIKDALDGMPLDEFSTYYENAKKIAEKIHGSSGIQLETQKLWVKFKRLPFFLANNLPFFSGGVADYKFLNTIYTNRFVSDQVHKEFYIDHLMVVGIVNLMPGADGRANYLQPQNLAANPYGILYASGPHLNDTTSNTYVHFFVSGAKTAMMYQSVKAHADELPSHGAVGRNNYVYDPFEDFQYLTKTREQGFFSSSYEWTMSLLTFKESRLGNFMLKSLKRRLTTLQGGFLTFLLFQMALIDNRLFSDVLMAYGLMFSAAYWKYALPWDPVQRGNNMIEGRFESRRLVLNIAKKNLLDAMKNSSDSVQLESAYKGMLVLYEKENPKALGRLRSTLKQFDRSVWDRVSKDILDSKENIYYGVLVRLAEALRTKNLAEQEQYKGVLIRMLNGERSREILELSAKGIFDLALTESPLYTQPSGILSFLTTLGAAIGTTVLAISLMTETTDLVNKPTWSYVASWMVANFALYGAAYLAFGAEPWIFYEKKWEEFKNKVKRTFKKQKDKEFLNVSSCVGYFK